MQKPEDVTVLVWDTGGYTYVAEALAPYFKKVYYWSEWRDPRPYYYKRFVGTGLPGVSRVKNPWFVINDVDLVVMPDVGFGGETEFLRKDYGKMVWGTGLGEVLELDRIELLKTQENMGLATPDYRIIRGVQNLREFLMAHDDVWVKINTFRGDLETFHNVTYSVSRPLLDVFLNRVSGIQEEVDFIVNFPIDNAVEIGYDGSCIDGAYSDTALWGIETKDKAYFAQVVPYKQIPDALQYVNEVFAPIFQGLGVRGFYSNEVRQQSAKKFILTDPCMRAGQPPAESYMQAFSNWAEHILAGAQGEVVDFEPSCDYVAQIMLYSDFFSSNRWLAVSFPEEFRARVALHGHVIQNDVDYCVSFEPDNPIFGAVVGTGPTLERAVAECLKVAEAIQATELEIDKTAFDNINKSIVELERHGISW